jgi:sensor histidine kinase regulating citrate/malate metabolism
VIRRRLAPGLLFVGVLMVVITAFESHHEARQTWVRFWLVDAEELGAFARGAQVGREDLLLAERVSRVAKREDVAYVLILDPTGRALIHGNPAEAGKRYESEYARNALEAKSTLVQEIPAIGVTEVDVPLESGVLRVGYTFRPMAPFSRALLAGTLLSCAVLAAAGLLLLRGGW